MHRILAIIIASFIALYLQAQKPRILNYTTHDDKAIHFGFCLGLNTMDFIVRNSYGHTPQDSMIADVTNANPGFHIQIISNYRLGEYFDLRFLPGISFGQRDIFFYNKEGKLIDQNHKLESNLLEFPFLLKYKAKRYYNFRPYLITGANFRVDLAKTFKEDEADPADNVYLDLKTFDLYHEIGIGFDFYLVYFKLGIELKYSYGMFNMLKERTTTRPEFQHSIDRLNSSIFMLSFNFE